MLEALKLIGRQPGLPQDAAQRAYRYFSMVRDNHGEHSFASLFDELDVAASLAGFCKTCRRELAGDLSLR